MGRSLTDFYRVKKLNEKDSPGRFSNIIFEVTKVPLAGEDPNSPKFTSPWYLKCLHDLDIAANETIAQELFRLYLPRQPKTRLVENNVISKKIAGHSVSLEGDKLRKLKCANGTYTGLGEIMVLALFVSEVDLKFDNLYVNEDYQIIKIDGDRCFYYHTYPATEDISSLPMVKHFHPFNWLDMLRYKVNTIPQLSSILPPALYKDPQFREEINKTLLKILLTPTHVFTKLINDLLPDHPKQQKDLSEKINFSRNKLYAAAMGDPSFVNYLLTNQVSDDFRQFRQQLSGFITKGKKTIEFEKCGEVYQLNFCKLVEVATQKKKNAYRNENASWKATLLNFFSKPAKPIRATATTKQFCAGR